MNKKMIALLLTATFIAACGKDEGPVAAIELPIRYAAVNLADIATAEALTNLCANEETLFREHLAALESYDGAPTIAGYYTSLDSLFASIGTVAQTAQSLSGVHPDAELRTAGEACAQLLSKVETDMSLSRPLYDAVSQLDVTETDDVTRHSIKKLLLSFQLAGVDKDDATRERIRELNDNIVAIGQEFDRNIREDVRYLELESVEDLAGLPDDYIAAHQPNEDGKILISTQYPDVFPFFEYADRDDLRKKMVMLYGLRGYPKNEAVLRKLIEARYELAQLIGFNNYAELVTADKMAGSPERVAAFIEELKGYTGDVQDREYEMLLARLRQDDPDAERVETWQRSYVQSKVSREQYGVDSKVIRQYFSYKNSREGIFTMVQELFGVRIEPWETDTWHEDVESYSLFSGDVELGRFYLDMHPREGKYQHAAMFPFVNGIQGRQLPIAGLICNFPKGDEPIQFSQVVTFLHEFGHLIHWQFAGHHAWSNVSGITSEWDFVEAPSQMLQEWVWDYETVSQFARNAAGEALPAELHASMVAERDFGLGMGTRRQLSYAALSLAMYNRDPAEIDFDSLSEEITREFTKFEPLEGTHTWSAFGHLNGYSAIYYTYQWSLAIATDMFTQFKAAGLRNVEVAGAYRDKVLASGGSRPAEEMVTDFLGREISFEPYADRLRGEGS
ncbi:MAG: Zn-dependent oligopeptidase [Gammaproteobacteria bacterium]|nr:Zn-dependent oligopeptidase [Gammaproteobacteria bacterium]MDH3432049.1 Zn-dependent oligopeptidase [Gammaproteobacteria bacterium]